MHQFTVMQVGKAENLKVDSMFLGWLFILCSTGNLLAESAPASGERRKTCDHY